MYLVRWRGKDRSGRPWGDSWQPAVNIEQSLIETYEGSLPTAVPHRVRVNINPVFEATRKTMSHVVALDTTRAEPVEHDIPLEIASLEEIAVPWLKLVSEVTGVRASRLTRMVPSPTRGT